jgi:myo-inositol catabolism protein IolS
VDYRLLGKSGIKISPIIMGTWQAGKDGWPGANDTASLRAIQAAFDAGINTFDTASAYGNGHSERLVGQALASVRTQVVLATKVIPQRLQYSQVIQACHNSLKNLNTDTIDLYQIHWPSGSFGSRTVPMEETMKALLKLKKEGKIRAIGVSNFSQAQLTEICQFGPIDSLQPPYSLFWRQIEADAAPFCVTESISILAYSSLAQGLLTGKYAPDHQFEDGDNRSLNKLFQPEHNKRIKAALDQLRQMAENKNITPGQLALAWLIAQPTTSAIVGAKNPEQVVQNAKAAELSLSAKELDEIGRISRTVTDALDSDPNPWIPGGKKSGYHHSHH